MGIGLSSNGVNLNRLPGWEKNSYGYHADDGCVFSCSGTGQQYGPTFTTGDIVGCGFNLVDRTIFFTKNGISLGTAVSDVPVSLSPYFSLSPSLSLLFFQHLLTCIHFSQVRYSTRQLVFRLLGRWLRQILGKLRLSLTLKEC